MFCGRCGNTLEDGMAFCDNCGAPTGGSPGSATPPPAPAAPAPVPSAPVAPAPVAYQPPVQPSPPVYAAPPQYPAPTAPKKGKGCLIAVVIVIVLLLCTCCGVPLIISATGGTVDLGEATLPDWVSKSLGIDTMIGDALDQFFPFGDGSDGGDGSGGTSP
jgi:hypothetical protein